MARAVCRAPGPFRSEHTSFCTCTLLAAGPAHMLNKVHPPEDPSQVQLFGRCGCTGRQPALRKTCKSEGVALVMHLLATGRHYRGCRMPVKCVVMSQQLHLRWSISASGCSAAWAATERRLHCCRCMRYTFWMGVAHLTAILLRISSSTIEFNAAQCAGRCLHTYAGGPCAGNTCSGTLPLESWTPHEVRGAGFVMMLS